MIPKISVIIPVYKVENNIKKCIESIQSQTYYNWELILVDDESPDNSGLICDEMSNGDLRIKVFHVKNGGPSYARNFGLKYASGEYVCFVDSDDWVEFTYLEHLYNGLQKKGNGLVVGGHVRDEASNSRIRSVGDKVYEKNAFHQIFEEQKIVHWGYTVAKLYNLNIIKQRGLKFSENIKYCEDLLFFLEYWKNCDWIKFIPETDYHYIISESPNSLIVSYNSFESELEGYYRCKQCFEELAYQYAASVEEIKHSYEWCSYMFTRALKTMYRKGRNKLPFRQRYNNLKNIVKSEDVSFAIKYPYYMSLDRLVLGLMHRRQYLLTDIILSLFFLMRYSKILTHLIMRK